MQRLTLWKSLACLLLLVPGAIAQLQVKSVVPDPENPANPPRVEVTLTSLYSTTPHFGYLPVEVKVDNRTDSVKNYTLNAKVSSGANGMSSEFEVSGAAHKTTTMLYFVPTLPNYNGLHTAHISTYHYTTTGGQVNLELSGGINPVQLQVPGSAMQAPSAMISAGVHAGDLDDLNRERANSFFAAIGHSYGSRSVEQFFGGFMASSLPADWRAYAGIDVLAMNSSEWLALAPGVRDSILQGVKMGSTLKIFGSNADTFQTLRLPNLGSSPFSGDLGAGKVIIEAMSGSKLLPKMHTLIPDQPIRVRKFDQESNRDQRWNHLHTSFGQRSFGAWQVGLILVLFGILVGPVNLFKLAPAGRRHRLFITTPIISLGASLLLIMVILLRDGTGGAGVRRATVYLSPDDASAYVEQREFCRTGVILSGKFTTAQAAVVTPVLWDSSSQWTRLKADNSYSYYRSSRGSNQGFALNKDGQYAGDYYQSRSEHALELQYVQSTRGRIELGGTFTAPTLTSSLAYECSVLFFRDQAHNIWQSSAPLATGKTISLNKVTNKEFEIWRDGHGFEAVALPAGCFATVVKASAAGLMNSLDSIEWDDAKSTAFIYGPVRPVGGAVATPTAPAASTHAPENQP